MTKETPFSNRKLLLEETTNNEKKNEIKEGRYYVVAKLYFKMMEIISVLVFAALVFIVKIERFIVKIQRRQRQVFVWLILCHLVIAEAEGQMEKYKNKEWQIVYSPMCNLWSLVKCKEKESQKKLREGQSRREQFLRKGRNKRYQLKTVTYEIFTYKILEIGNLGMRQVDEQFWIKKNSRTKVDGLFENWFRTERRRHVVVQGVAKMERGKLIDNPEEFIGELDNAVKGRHVVVQGCAQKERGKLIDNSEKLSGKSDDAEKEIQELEKLLRCKVCLDSDACIVFLPCRHMATCEYCEGFLHHCPVCRSFIEEAVKINEE